MTDTGKSPRSELQSASGSPPLPLWTLEKLTSVAHSQNLVVNGLINKELDLWAFGDCL